LQVTPKETNRSVSGLGKESGDKVKTDFLPVKKWRALSAELQATVRAARGKDLEIKKQSVLDRRDRKIKTLLKKVSALKRNATMKPKTTMTLMTTMSMLMPVQAKHWVAERRRNRPRKGARSDGYLASSCNFWCGGP
jgi:hypothetical protein